MPRRKSTDTREVRALRKLLLSLGLSATTADQLIARVGERTADLSAKACDVQLYIAAHPEVRSPRDCAAKMLYNFVNEAARTPTVSRTEPTIPCEPGTPPPPPMELWGYDDQNA